MRRCTPCRLRRCFDMGMKEELVRTPEENLRHNELIASNRRSRELFHLKRQQKLTMPQVKDSFTRILIN